MPLPPLVRYLDPRPALEADANPIANSVNIPLEELHGRMHELPSKGKAILVVGSVPEAVTYLRDCGREAQLAPNFMAGERKAGRLWEPNEFLLQAIDGIAPGTALDLACGTGRDAVALAGNGWRVVAVDWLPDALDRGRSLASRYLLPSEAAKIDWRLDDLESGLFRVSEPVELVTMFWYLNRSLIVHTRELLKPGGLLVLETFTEHHRQHFGKPRREEFVLRPGEVSELARSLRILQCDESWHGDRHSVRLVAVREG